MKQLLLSNSTIPGQQYFEWAIPKMNHFLGETEGPIIFIPFAAVGFSYEAYEEKVNEALQRIGRSAISIHRFPDPKEALFRAEAILVGGGNTFELARKLQRLELMPIIKGRVQAGKPYCGWSAGSNIACPSIKTTNDMPITEPLSFNGIDLFPYQINPHYTEKTIDGHGGESRKQRLKEYVAINDTPVLCLPEGTGLEVNGEQIEYFGREDGLIMSRESESRLEVGSTVPWRQ